MAATVAAPLERRIGEISGVTELTSSSRLGFTSVTVQFDIRRNVEDAARDVQAAINGAQADLPGNLSRRPQIRKFNPSGTPILILAITSPTRRPADIYDIADLVVATRISQIDGVAEVQVGGAQQPAIRVTVDPAALQAKRIGLETVRNAIAEANALLPLGQLDGPDKSFIITTGGQLGAVRDYASIVLKNERGTVVRLGDVARIEESTSNRLAAGAFNNEPAIIVIIQKTAEGNVVKTVDAIQCLAAGGAEAHSPGREDLHHVRSDARHPQKYPGSGGHARGEHLPGDARRIRFSAPSGADLRRDDRRAALARRYCHGNVVFRVQPRQCLLAGADDFRRVRRR